MIFCYLLRILQKLIEPLRMPYTMIGTKGLTHKDSSKTPFLTSELQDLFK